MKWLSKCGLSAAIIIMSLWLAAAIGIGETDSIVVSTDATNLRLAKRYLEGPPPNVVLVGSSLTYRLSESFFQTSRLKNLSFAGGASMTGLEIIKSAPTRPRTILVEANILTRETDPKLLQQALSRSIEPLRIVRWLGAKYRNWKSQNRTESAEELLSKPASPQTSFSHLTPSQGAAGDGDIAQAKANLAKLKAIISELERDGSRVLWFEVPYQPDLQRRPYATAMSSLVHSATDRSTWLDLTVNNDELRWSDGEHLDARSSAIFARAIDRAITRLPK